MDWRRKFVDVVKTEKNLQMGIWTSSIQCTIVKNQALRSLFILKQFNLINYSNTKTR